MTEITEDTTELPEPVQRFVLHWGEMGKSWGVNRSVAQVHALLYLSNKPMTAEEISKVLNIARSNVSTAVHELVGWDLIRRVHVMGDRRDHFEAETDLWEMLQRIAAGRKKREIDPTIEMLRSCATEMSGDKEISKEAKTRLQSMLSFLEQLDSWYGQMVKLPRWKQKALIKMGGAISRFISAKKGSEEEKE